MNRRSFLTLLGLAPIAAPAVVAAASAPRVATMRFVGASTPYLGAGRRILLADEVDSYAAIAAQGSTAELIEQRLITWPEGPEKARLRAELVSMVGSDGSSAAVLAWRSRPPIDCPVIVDDVGSGP